MAVLDGRLPRCKTLSRLCPSMMACDEQGIVHRDIKPANLMLSTGGRGQGSGDKGQETGSRSQGTGVRSQVSVSGQSSLTPDACPLTPVVKILDLGLARFDADALDDESDLDRLTGSSQMMGTCDYMAPEQALDTHGADHRADVYSLGCTLYRLLTGRRPYTGTTPMRVLLAHREAPIPSLCEDRDDVAEELDAVFQKMVAKEPADRYQSMGTVIEALRSCVAPIEEGEEEAPSDAALASFLQDIAHGGSGTGLTRAPATGSNVESQPAAKAPLSKPSAKEPASSKPVASESAPSRPAKPDVPLRRRLLPYLAVGGPVLALLVLAGVLVLLVGPDEAPPSLGMLIAEGPLTEVEIAARHQDDDLYRPLELDDEGRVELKPGEYRLGLTRGHEKYRVVPDRVTLDSGGQLAVRIELKPPETLDAPFDTVEPSGDATAGENDLPGVIPRPAELPGLGRWQVETNWPRSDPFAVSWHPTDGRVACGMENGLVRIYDAQKTQLVGLLRGHSKPVIRVAWSLDGRWLVSVGEDGVVRFWQADGTPATVLEGYLDRTTCVAWSPDNQWLLFGGSDGSVRLRNIDGTERPAWKSHEGAVRDVAWNPTSDRFVSAGEDKTLRLWQADGTLGEVLKGHTDAVQSVAWHPYGRWLASGSSDGTVRLWQSDGTPGPVLEDHTGSVTCVAWSGDGQLLASGSRDGRIEVPTPAEFQERAAEAAKSATDTRPPMTEREVRE